MVDESITIKRGPDEQMITFHHLSDDDAIASHEIIYRLFRSMHEKQVNAELGWLRGKYGIS